MKELVLKNCTLYENDIKRERVYIHIKNGFIEDIGQNDPLCSCEYIDCCERLVLPGFIDSHLHLPGNMLYEECGINLQKCTSFDEYISVLKEKKSEYESGETVLGFGWTDNTMYCSEEYINNFDFSNILDEIFPNNPVVIYSLDFHSAWCNTYTLHILGDVLKKKHGELEQNRRKGILIEEEIDRIKENEAIFSFSKNKFKKAFLAYQDILLKKGITSANTFMFINTAPSKAWCALKELEEEGRLIVNINGYVAAEPYMQPKRVLEEFERMQKMNSEKIRINTVKLYIDGVVENKTAYLKEPYSNSEEYRGEPIWERKKLFEMCKSLDENNIQIHAHAIGDAAVKQFTDVMAEVFECNQNTQNRHTIAHLQLVDEEEIRKMSILGIIACVQPFWIYDEMASNFVDYKMLGKRAETEYKIGSIISKGVVLTSSSDSPVTEDVSPFAAICRATARERIDERATVGQMVESYTVNGAYQLKREKIGRLEKGCAADIIVVSKNIYEISPEEISSARCVMTLSEGRIVYED